MDSIKRLTELFSRFPTIGPRTASRFVFYLLRLEPAQVQQLAEAILDLTKKVSICQFCFNPFERSDQPLCDICTDPKRNRQLLCVVEKEADLLSIEKMGGYRGLYVILGGLAGFAKNGTEHLRLQPLKERVKNPAAFGVTDSVIKEIIIAINPTLEGNSTTSLVLQELKSLPDAGQRSITRLAQGLPAGGELEYADQETLQSALEGRK